MVKIQSQAGNSLADTYDVEGSIAGIDQLLTRDLPIVHEMGATVFSERFRSTWRRVTTSQNQNAAFTLTISNFPQTITRLLGFQVISDDATRVATLQASIMAAEDEQDFPVWVYGGTSVSARVNDSDTVAAFDVLQPVAGSVFLPSFVGGSDQGPNPVSDLRVRGNTTGFGAGTVIVTALVFLAFTFTPNVSSRGLPIPSW